MERTQPIDFVIPWVSDTDTAWQKEREKYQKAYLKTEGTSDVRFRDWDNLQYWFRSVESNAPWVNRIHLITCGHVPTWLNREHPKLNIVTHRDYIPEDFLPTFNSHTIELNLHRIPNLTENFVYFNDDIFLLRPTHETDFFKNNLPCDTFSLNCIFFGYDSVGHIHGADIAFINQFIHKSEVSRKNWRKWFHPRNGIKSLIRTSLLMPWPWFPGFYYQHLANSYQKKVFNILWEIAPEVLYNTCLCKFREDLNVNQWIFKFWQLATGNFYPKNPARGHCFHVKESNLEILCRAIEKKSYQMICINDVKKTENFQCKKELINKKLEKLFPRKSLYEL